jgi:translation elongation factor EF-1alpha
VLHVHSSATACRFSRLMSLLDGKTGAVAKRGPAFRVLLKDQMAVVELTMEDEVCMEALAGQSCLKRIVLRIGGAVVAVGTLLEVLDGLETGSRPN